MIKNRKVYKPFMCYCAKVIPLAFDESLSYYECICNIANHINNEIIPKVNQSNEIVNTVEDEFILLKNYVDDNMLTKDINDLTYYTLTSNLSTVALSGSYDDLSNKPTIPDVSNFITKDADDLTYYTTTTSLTSLLNNKENIIETGSSATGVYIKYDSGILIQYGIIDKTNFSTTSDVSTAVQGINIYRSNNPSIVLPTSFIDTNYSLSLEAYNGLNGCRFISTRIGTKTISGFGLQLIGLESFSTSSVGYTNLTDVEWLAIGKWK